MTPKRPIVTIHIIDNGIPDGQPFVVAFRDVHVDEIMNLIEVDLNGRPPNERS